MQCCTNFFKYFFNNGGSTMSTKNLFSKHLLAFILCFAILAPSTLGIDPLAPDTENIAPCSDRVAIIAES